MRIALVPRKQDPVFGQPEDDVYFATEKGQVIAASRAEEEVDDERKRLVKVAQEEDDDTKQLWVSI